jgi:hypothetical protein
VSASGAQNGRWALHSRRYSIVTVGAKSLNIEFFTLTETTHASYDSVTVDI